MNYSMLVEQIRKLENRKMMFELTKSKIKLIEKEISNIEQKIKKIDEFLEKELKQYRVSFDKNKNRTISNKEFEIIDQIHRHRLNSMHLKKLSYEIKLNSKKDLIQRSLCFCWLLKLPYGKESVELVKEETKTKAIVNKKEIYNKYLEVVINSEREKLKKQRSFYRLQLDFNKSPDYLVFKNHEFYEDSDLVSKKLENVKEKIENLKNYETKINGKYTDFVDYHQLTIGDFIVENNQLFDQLFLNNNENDRKRAI